MLFHSSFKDKIESTRVSKNQLESNYSYTCATYGGSNAACSVVYNADSAFSEGIEAAFGIKPYYGGWILM